MKLFGVSIGEENAKLGGVFNFSLPSHKTCPGASPWCLTHCYARRLEQLRPTCRRAYEANLTLAQDQQEFRRVMIGVLPRILECFRIHVSGDFFDAQYVRCWTEVCAAFPRTRFWAYTRSWAVPELSNALAELRDAPNVQLIASTDRDMALPSAGWRVAFVRGDPRADGRPCSAQTGRHESCLACGYCFRQDAGNVVFTVH
ncbi:hypothetical protein ACFL34_04860 [Candidatus Sumerlaeota bacterium]